MSKRKCWVAKCSDNLGKLHDYELSPRFESIYDCQQYIDDNLKFLEGRLDDIFTEILLFHGKSTGHYFITLGGSFIRCFHVYQKRFATGFDF